jgi:transporter family protein
MSIWIVCGLLSAVFAALVAIFGKMGMAKIDSTLATTLRAIIMAVLLTLFSLRHGVGKQFWLLL